MKKFTSIIFLLAISFNLYSQQPSTSFLNRNSHNILNKINFVGLNNSSMPIKEYYSEWDTTTNVWVMRDSIFLVYDVNGNVTELMKWSFKNGISDIQKFTYTYNGNNQLTSDLTQQWFGNRFDSTNRTTITYDINNNILTKLLEEWTPSVGFYNTYRYTYAYDINDYNTSLVIHWDNRVSNVWENVFKQEYTLNAVGQPTTLVSFSANGPSGWTQKTLMINPIYYKWNNRIDDSYLSYYEYQTWNGSLWQNLGKKLLAYDQYGFQTKDSSLKWNGSVYTFADYNTDDYTYDINNNLTFDVYKAWSSVTNGLRNAKKYEYKYLTNSSLGFNELETTNSFFVYPNPVKNSITVFSLRATTIYIYNTIGESVYSQKIPQGKSTIDMNTLLSGVYFINTENERIKFIKE